MPKIATRDKVLAVVEAYARGGFIEAICADFAIDWHTVRRYVSADPALSRMYDDAKKARTDLFADQIISISDSEEIPSDRARNMIMARQWYASKLNRQEYGEKIDVAVTQQIDLRAAIDAGRRRVLQPVCDPAKAIDAEVSEIPALSAPQATDDKSVRSLTNANLDDVDPFS